MSPRVRGKALARHVAEVVPPHPPLARPQSPVWATPGSRSMTPSTSSWLASMNKKSRVSQQAKVTLPVSSRLVLVAKGAVLENTGELGNHSLMVCSGYSCLPLTRESRIASGQQTPTPGRVSRLRYH